MTDTRQQRLHAQPRVEQPQTFPPGTPAIIYALCAADPTQSTEQAGAVLLAMISGVAAAEAVMEQDDALAQQLDHRLDQLAEEARSTARQHQRGDARSLRLSPP